MALQYRGSVILFTVLLVAIGTEERGLGMSSPLLLVLSGELRPLCGPSRELVRALAFTGFRSEVLFIKSSFDQ